ncbi:MAG: DUF6526 family protein [Gemmatimonadetes bacterium]|nr:DUF6526 family protein [Gemmatimonadota bacterium]
MSKEPQSFENHVRVVPGFHYVAYGLVFAALVLSVTLLVRDFSLEHVALLLLSVGAALALVYARLFPLGVQDRLIRLEERLRLERLLPEDLRPRIEDLTTRQLIGLRFASDEEVVELTRRVLDDGITDRKAIKAMVKSWRADYERI